MREGDVLARIGGDVFGVIVRLTDGPGDALNVASLIQEALSHPFRVNGRELIVRATIGIATPHADGVSSEELIGNAEFAVTRAKRQGRRVEIYHPADATAARRRFTLETELRQANEREDRKSEEHTSELQSLMRISYAVFCLKKKKPMNSRNIN